ncbi:MAG: hypothetical protein AAGD10_14525 [Myxococcota bacterium]
MRSLVFGAALLVASAACESSPTQKFEEGAKKMARSLQELEEEAQRIFEAGRRQLGGELEALREALGALDESVDQEAETWRKETIGQLEALQKQWREAKLGTRKASDEMVKRIDAAHADAHRKLEAALRTLRDSGEAASQEARSAVDEALRSAQEALAEARSSSADP